VPNNDPYEAPRIKILRIIVSPPRLGFLAPERSFFACSAEGLTRNMVQTIFFSGQRAKCADLCRPARFIGSIVDELLREGPRDQDPSWSVEV
jgi:hypothetical protein